MADDPQRAQRALELLEKKLWNDSKLGPDVQRVAKEMFPDIKTNDEIFEPAVAPIKAELEETKRRLAEFEERDSKERNERAEAKALNDMQARINSAQREYSLTDEGRDLMIERMKSTGNYADASAAAAWVVSKAPAPSAQPTWKSQSLNLFGTKDKDEGFARLHENPQEYMEDELVEFSRDPDAYVRMYG